MENIKNKISFKTYDKYKDSEVEYIGNIPEHWEIDMLKNNIYKIISGGTPNTSNKQFWENGYINWCNIKDMGKNLELQKTSKKITIKGKEDKNLKIIPINTILISIYATLGRINITKIETTINQAILAIFENKNKINKKYLIYFLIMLEKNILIFANLNTQFNLNAEIVKNFILSFPPKKEQQAISTFLDKKVEQIDKRISILKRKKELLEEYKQSLINQVVTKGIESLTKKDKYGNLIDFDNKQNLSKEEFDIYMNENGYKDSGIEYIGYIPKHWEVGRMKDNIKLFHGYSFKEKDICNNSNKYLIKITQIENNKISLKKAKTLIYNPIFEKYKVLDNDLLIALSGATSGKVGFYKEKKDAYLNQRVARIESKQMDKKYVYYWFSLKSLIEQMYIFSNITAQPNFNNNILEIKNIILPIKEQNNIATFLDKKVKQIDKKIELIDKEINLLEEYKQVIINEVVTGKIKVIKD